MKALLLNSFFILVVIMGLSFKEKAPLDNDPIKLEATYKGTDFSGYTFGYLDDDDEEIELTFDDISQELLSKYDLDDEKFIGKKFEIIYSIIISDDEYESEVPVLNSLKLIK
ncbi:hypothetical protein [Tenacibaculum xiamenense]|uniref:hypothetical protein n=1 Tax=Tenacibaculum xiamenense TaxID=1261553 RepID=UPI003894EF03